MNAQKWFYCTMYLATLAGAGSMSWQMGRMEAQRQDEQPACLTRALPAMEKASYFDASEMKPAVSASDAEIKQYYFDHIWEFQPLPHSPRERAKVWREIELAICQKLAARSS